MPVLINLGRLLMLGVWAFLILRRFIKANGLEIGIRRHGNGVTGKTSV